MNPMPKEFYTFEQLYDSMQAALEEYVAHGAAAGRLNADDQYWFQFMSTAFRGEYYNWPYAPKPVQEYLALFSDAPRALRQAAHAFLHIAYDLPRVVSWTLKPSFSVAERTERRALFLEPTPLFRRQFMQNLRKGGGGWWLRPLGYLQPAETLSYWLLNLRAVAWIHAETLADVPDPNPYIDALAVGLLRAGHRSRGRQWRLDNSTFWRASPVALVADHPLASSITVGALILAGAAVQVRRRNARIAQEIASLGAWVQIETARALFNQGTRGPRNERREPVPG